MNIGRNQFARNIRYDGNVVVDLTRFIRVLCNLIKNAREAMPSGSILTISTGLIDNQVVIQISDTGIGIPAELLPKLFEPFVTHGKSHGPGLGLTIAKSVVTAHNGKISVSSVEGSGTTVDIRLPAQSLPFGGDFAALTCRTHLPSKNRSYEGKSRFSMRCFPRKLAQQNEKRRSLLAKCSPSGRTLR